MAAEFRHVANRQHLLGQDFVRLPTLRMWPNQVQVSCPASKVCSGLVVVRLSLEERHLALAVELLGPHDLCGFMGESAALASLSGNKTLLDCCTPSASHRSR